MKQIHLPSPVQSLLLTLLALGLSALPAAALPQASTEEGKQPDVVFIIVDDLNDWIGVMGGHPQTLTPNIDALARQGMLFTNAHCNAPQCTPSRVSLLSGLYPKSTGKYFNNTRRPPFFGQQPMSGKTSRAVHENPIDVHDHFQSHNYRVVSGGKVASYRKPSRSLDAYLPLPREPKDAVFPAGKRNLWGDGGAYAREDEQTGDYKVAQWALEQWNTASDKPLFMTVGFYRPHRPLNVPKKYFDRFPIDQVELPEVPTEDDWADLPAYAKALARSHAHKPFHKGKFSDHELILERGGEAEWKYTVASYLACVSYVDTQIGLLLEGLKQNPRGRKTVVMLTSDHGWHLGEKKHWCKGAIWKNTTNVPLIVVAPGLTQAGSRSNQPVSLVDVYPSLCDLAGLQAPQHLEGESIVPLIKDPAQKRAFAFLSYGPQNTAVQTESMRYIRYEDGSEELYDHRTDPHEWVNLAGQEEFHSIKETLKLRALKFQDE